VGKQPSRTSIPNSWSTNNFFTPEAMWKPFGEGDYSYTWQSQSYRKLTRNCEQIWKTWAKRYHVLCGEKKGERNNRGCRIHTTRSQQNLNSLLSATNGAHTLQLREEQKWTISETNKGLTFDTQNFQWENKCIRYLCLIRNLIGLLTTWTSELSQRRKFHAFCWKGNHKNLEP
jgi:hypothetical protein